MARARRKTTCLGRLHLELVVRAKEGRFFVARLFRRSQREFDLRDRTKRESDDPTTAVVKYTSLLCFTSTRSRFLTNFLG